jgi:hypothetical protein
VEKSEREVMRPTSGVGRWEEVEKAGERIQDDGAGKGRGRTSEVS